jgi:hypothetical protein
VQSLENPLSKLSTGLKFFSLHQLWEFWAQICKPGSGNLNRRFEFTKQSSILYLSCTVAQIGGEILPGHGNITPLNRANKLGIHPPLLLSCHADALKGEAK